MVDPPTDDHFGQLVADSELSQRELLQTTLSIRATTVRTHEVIASSRDLLATIEKLLAQ